VALISIKRRDDEKVIELGGGDAPLFRPNVDVRPGPQTDFVADFNGPLPITSEEWDVVFAKYVVEHLSWRNVRGFLAECLRILKPGGRLVFITAPTPAAGTAGVRSSRSPACSSATRTTTRTRTATGWTRRSSSTC
jgi:ubiquinone/menaquinone biosynthesis C-methylase UbiE